MTNAAVPMQAPGAPVARPVRRFGVGWLGMVPFLAFAFLFLIAPTFFLVAGSLQTANGAFTLQNFADLFTPQIITTYENSLEISIVTALIGGVFGFLLAYAVILGGLPGILRSALMTFSGVASNFAGVPLALAFVYTVGRTGLFIVFLKSLGIDLYDNGFTIYSKIGLEIVYLYFQFPLMVLIIAPAIDGLKKDWREAAENMGASSFQYWRRVALPILMPSLLGSMILLFANAFGAQATAYQLTGGFIDIVTIAISRQMRGDVLFNPNQGYALAMGMVVIMAISIAGYSLLQRRSERWLK
ncbi:MAG TPA: ABC transporter permease subunit [Candidatus Limnocylindrales bacterium]|nr:ABC transporter permease subunit [Candidatus Limnocylindrales bacterium]